MLSRLAGEIIDGRVSLAANVVSPRTCVCMRGCVLRVRAGLNRCSQVGRQGDGSRPTVGPVGSRVGPGRTTRDERPGHCLLGGRKGAAVVVVAVVVGGSGGASDAA